MRRRTQTAVRALLGGVASIAAIASIALVGLAPGASAAPVGVREGMEVLCSSAGYSCVEGTGYRGQSHWGANYFKTGHNCTSYVSYRLAQLGVAQPWRPMGNANQWNPNGARHVVIDDRPAPGAVAQWEGGTRFAPNPSGHVAYVESVQGDIIELTDDSYSGGTRRVRLHRGSPYWPSNFIHIHDLAVAPKATITRGEWVLGGHRAAASIATGLARFGGAGDIPLVGDWDGDGDDTVGVFRDGTFTIADANSGKRQRPRTFAFGRPGDVPVVGDWNADGRDTVGVFRDGTWFLAKSNRTDTDVVEVRLGAAGDIPLVGDWDGDQRDTFGVFRDGVWPLTDSPFAAAAQIHQVRFGAPGDRPLAGDWDGLHGDSIGTFRDGTFTLAGETSSAPRSIRSIVFGGPEQVPVTGRWTRRGVDTVGMVR